MGPMMWSLRLTLATILFFMGPAAGYASPKRSFDLVPTMGSAAPIDAIAMSGDGRLVATASAPAPDRGVELKIWNRDDGLLLRVIAAGTAGQLLFSDVAFSKN